MENDKLNDRENKTNGDAQVAVIEMRELNHCSRSSVSGESKRSG